LIVAVPIDGRCITAELPELRNTRVTSLSISTAEHRDVSEVSLALRDTPLVARLVLTADQAVG
jgi:hypothetical protein